MAVLLLALTLLLVLAMARRALEPQCPNCSVKSWSAHSTQLQCTGCGWANGRPAAAQPEPQPAAQYEICFHA